MIGSDRHTTTEHLTDVDAEATTPVQAPSPPWWVRLRRAFFGPATAPDDETRLQSLDYAIERYPEAPANYVLRGELYLQHARYDAAAFDFKEALRLCEAELEQNAWGVVAQTLRDRALTGLEHAEAQAKKRY